MTPPKKSNGYTNKTIRIRLHVRTWRFRFLDLPPEIRNEVYRLILQRPHKIHLTELNKELNDDRSDLAITKVSRQIQQESISVFFRLNASRSGNMRATTWEKVPSEGPE